MLLTPPPPQAAALRGSASAVAAVVAQGNARTQALMRLRYLQHQLLPSASAPQYDVEGALDVLVGGGYPRFPALVEHQVGIGMPAAVTNGVTDHAAVAEEIHASIRERLLTTAMPSAVRGLAQDSVTARTLAQLTHLTCVCVHVLFHR